MTLALSECEFSIEQKRAQRRPREFLGRELHALLQGAGGNVLSPAMSAVLERVRELRGSGVTWASHLKLRDLLQKYPEMDAGTDEAGKAAAPLVFFKLELSRLIPKVVVQVVADHSADAPELCRMHQAYRGTGIEFMCLKERHLSGEFLYAKRFKRAFYGAFFCDGAMSDSIYCPSLREMGFCAWRELAN